MARSIIPHHQAIKYILNDETGYFVKQAGLTSFNKLPEELKVEQTFKPFLINQGANHIIRGRIKDGVYTFFTGIKKTSFENLFTGDHYTPGAKKKKSLVLFDFSNGFKAFTAYYFPGLMKVPPALEPFLRGAFTNQIRQKETDSLNGIKKGAGYHTSP